MELGQFWQFAISLRYRSQRFQEIYYEEGGEGGSGYAGWITPTSVNVQFNYKVGGVWQGWAVVHTFPVSYGSSTSWLEDDIVLTKQGSFDNLQIAVQAVAQTAVNIGDSGATSASDTYYNNIDDVSIVARALVR